MWTKSHACMGGPCPEAQTSRVSESCEHLQNPSMHKGTNATPTHMLCKLSWLLDSLSENPESLYAFMHPNLPAFPLLEHTLTCHICKSLLWWGHPGTFRSFLRVQECSLPKGLVRVCSRTFSFLLLSRSPFQNGNSIGPNSYLETKIWLQDEASWGMNQAPYMTGSPLWSQLDSLTMNWCPFHSD